MDQALMALIRKDSEARFQKFKIDHEVFIVAFNHKPLLSLGLKRGRDMDEAFATTVKKMRSDRDIFSDVNYLKGRLPLTNPDFGKIFWYLVLALTMKGQAKREAIEQNVRQSLEALFEPFGLEFAVASTLIDPDIVDVHIARYEMPHWVRTPASAPASDRPKTRRKSRQPSDFPKELDFTTSSMKVVTFLEKLSKGANLICNPLSIADFTLESNRHYKYWRTEWLGIKAYLSWLGYSDEDTIELGFEIDRLDARVRRENKPDILIEVTQALPKNAHLVRHAIVRHGRLPPDFRLRTLHQKGVDAFPDPIINAIADKHEKVYPIGTTLLVTVLGEYTGEDDAVINAWIEEVRLRIQIGKFSAIYLVEIARSRIFKIF
ncbi:hypothetical protein [Stenotrophomonas sp. PS02297]|uniref:hypothetical protein n=1 Tax=Stenotrophomonas sp. PS02297 TaxID=2991423 RepID=UPI00249AE147|nr:hypothetical protein [Stenotrophomonas sp. PS02297]